LLIFFHFWGFFLYFGGDILNFLRAFCIFREDFVFFGKKNHELTFVFFEGILILPFFRTAIES
jgi:hypothetical protein